MPRKWLLPLQSLIHVFLILATGLQLGKALSCKSYQFNCEIFLGTPDNNDNDELSTLMCRSSSNNLRSGTDILCEITGTAPTRTLILDYKPNGKRAPVVDFIDPKLGSFLVSLGISRLDVRLLVRTYPHVFSTQFPEQFDTLAINITATTCVDFAAFLWTRLSSDRAITLYHGEGPCNYTTACVRVNISGGGHDLVNEECLYKANYTHMERDFIFYLRTQPQQCLQNCLLSAEERRSRTSVADNATARSISAVILPLVTSEKNGVEFVEVNRFLPGHQCVHYSNMSSMRLGLVPGIIVGIAIACCILVLIAVFRIRDGKCGSRWFCCLQRKYKQAAQNEEIT